MAGDGTEGAPARPRPRRDPRCGTPPPARASRRPVPSHLSSNVERRVAAPRARRGVSAGTVRGIRSGVTTDDLPRIDGDDRDGDPEAVLYSTVPLEAEARPTSSSSRASV